MAEVIPVLGLASVKIFKAFTQARTSTAIVTVGNVVNCNIKVSASSFLASNCSGLVPLLIADARLP